MKILKIQKTKSIKKSSKIGKSQEKKPIRKKNVLKYYLIKKKIKENNSICKNNNINLIKKKEKEMNNNSLITAIESNNYIKLQEIIKTNLSRINKLNNNGFSPFHISVIILYIFKTNS